MTAVINTWELLGVQRVELHNKAVSDTKLTASAAAVTVMIVNYTYLRREAATELKVWQCLAAAG